MVFGSMGFDVLFVEHWLADRFRRIGIFVARRPISIMTACLVLSAVCCGGLPMIKSESKAKVLYTPDRNNRAREEEAMWSKLREGSLIPSYRQSTVIALKEGGNMLERETLSQLHGLDKKIKAMTFQQDGQTKMFSDVCARSKTVPGQCAPTGIFDVVDESAPDPYAPLLALPAGFILYPSGDRDVTQMRLGGRILSQDESLVSQAKAVRMTYRTDSELWEDQFLEMLEKDHTNELATKGYDLVYEISSSNQDELAKSTGADTCLVMVCFVVILMFTSVIMNSLYDTIASKICVSLPSVLACGMSVGSAFGLMGYFGVRFNPVVATSAFLLLGLGVDDSYVLMQAYHMSAKTLPADHTIEDRIGDTLQHAGVSIFFTSVTDMIAFLVGVSSVFPSIQQFCAYTATGIAFALTYQVLFFGAALALDAHREYMEVPFWYGMMGKGWLWGDKYDSQKTAQRGRVVVPEGDDVAVKRVRMMHDAEVVTGWAQVYGEWLLRPVPSFCIIVIWAGYLGAALYGTVKIETGLDTRDLAPSDSYWSKYVTTAFDYFQEQGPYIYLAYGEGTADFGDPAVRESMRLLRLNVEELECIQQANIGTWMGDHQAWVDAVGGATTWSSLSGDAFHTSVASWLGTPYGKRWEDYIFFTPEGTIKGAADVVQMQKLSTTSGDSEGVPCMRKMRETIDKFDVALLKPYPKAEPPFIHLNVFIFWEASAVILAQTLQNLGFAALCCFIITMFILPHPVLCTLTMAVVAMILIGVVGSMYLIHNIRIETISMIHLVLAIGFSIDNVAHYCHAYMSSSEIKRRDRAIDALKRIMAPILQGDISTMIALLCLLASKSKIFQSFFKVLFTVLFLGALHSIVLLPVVLGYLGPQGNTNSWGEQTPSDSDQIGSAITSQYSQKTVRSPESVRAELAISHDLPSEAASTDHVLHQAASTDLVLENASINVSPGGVKSQSLESIDLEKKPEIQQVPSLQSTESNSLAPLSNPTIAKQDQQQQQEEEEKEQQQVIDKERHQWRESPDNSAKNILHNKLASQSAGNNLPGVTDRADSPNSSAVQM